MPLTCLLYTSTIFSIWHNISGSILSSWWKNHSKKMCIRDRLLDVQHVKKIYKTRFKGNQVEALKDIHFTVDKGDYVAIMGESGSGKSTLLNILAMLDKPTAGRVYLNLSLIHIYSC